MIPDYVSVKCELHANKHVYTQLSLLLAVGVTHPAASHSCLDFQSVMDSSLELGADAFFSRAALGWDIFIIATEMKPGYKMFLSTWLETRMADVKGELSREVFFCLLVSPPAHFMSSLN